MRTTKHLRRILLCLSLCLAVVGGQTLAAGPKVFRFYDDSGNLVISHVVPNHRVKYGYEILDGTTYAVIETILPQLTVEQAQIKARRDHDLAVCKAKLQRVQALYRSIDDVDYSEEQVIASLDTRIVNANANVVHLRNQLDDLQSRAARAERAGSEPTAALVSNIGRTETQIANLQAEIQQRRQEQNQKRGEFEDDRKMLGISDCEVVVGPITVQPNAAVSRAAH
ncbi:MAG: hypothetical protein O7C67_14745 [Gammaproteobacteria bacterium]|nr:hypothetical protein [Gammaproteobacteria bacterium]